MNHPHVQLCMPEGPMGPIVKPMEWRRHNQSKLFLRDWREFMQPLKIRRRIFMAARQQFVIEPEKNRARAWWFGLSQYERDCWLGRRADGGFPKILHAAGFFKGPKFQRGNFAMFPAGTIAHGGRDFILSLASGSNTAQNIEISPSFALYATFQTERDGELRRDNSGDTNAGRSLAQINATSDWITPRNSTVGDDYEIKWNFLTGTVGTINDENYTEDIWSALSSDRRVGSVEIGTSTINTFELDIGDIGVNVSDVNQDYQIEAGDLL